MAREPAPPRPCFSGALPSLDRQGIIQGIYQRLWCKTDFETNSETMSAVFWYSLQGDELKKPYIYRVVLPESKIIHEHL
jgi:hypothetical protein